MTVYPTDRSVGIKTSPTSGEMSVEEGSIFGKPEAYSPSAIERFWAKVDKRDDDECWPWTATRDRPNSYGRFQVGRKNHRAHRVAYELEHGRVPPGLVVMHRCDNPPCCNPAHLRLGTQAQNHMDSVAKGRLASAILNPADVVEARYRYEAGQACVSLAIEFGVNEFVMWEALTGRTWAFAGGPFAKASPREPRRVRRVSASGMPVRVCVAGGDVAVDVVDVREGEWANPWHVEAVVDRVSPMGLEVPVFRVVGPVGVVAEYGSEFAAAWRAVEEFEAWTKVWTPALVEGARDALGGKPLGCDCPESARCHVDVLLAVANPHAKAPVGAP